MPSTIIPAIPLPYVQRRRKNQAERIQALKKVEAAAALATEASLLATPDDSSSSNILTNAPIHEEHLDVVSNLHKPVTSDPSEIRLECADKDIICQVSMKSIINKSPIEIEGTINSRRDDIKVGNIDCMENGQKQEGSERAKKSSIDLPVLIDCYQQCMISQATREAAPDLTSSHLSLTNDKFFEPIRFSPQHTLGVQSVNHNGGVAITGHSGSTGSSPAPPQSTVHTASAYGYGKTLPGYHAQVPANIQHIPAVYSMQPPPPLAHYSRSDGFSYGAFINDLSRRQIISPDLPDGISPSTAPNEARHLFNPTASRSFHGSQTSTQDNDSGTSFFKQFSTKVISNGGNGRIEDIRSIYSKSSANRSVEQFSLPLVIRNQATQIDVFDGLPEYLITQFADPVFSDCILELRYSDDRAAPIRIPGHSMIFARSITLREIILATRRECEGMASKTFLIETNDRFICTNGFYMAVHRLYGSSLLDLGPIIPMCPASQQNVPFNVTTIDRFNLAIGYAAAGHLLKLDGVVNRGCEIAGLALNWETLEKGLDFALDDRLEVQWNAQGWDYRSPRATYGPGVNMIIYKAMELICHNFPVGFEIDTSVGEAKFAPRLPAIPNQRRSSLSSRLSQIKFGDYATEDSQYSTNLQTPRVILSRVLINLPWDLLRFIFESADLASTVGNLAIHHRILSDIIKERERRRLNVINCSKLKPEYSKLSREWEAVRWEESVKELCKDDRWPKLTRTWVNVNTLEP